jgi:hypothetical protein
MIHILKILKKYRAHLSLLVASSLVTFFLAEGLLTVYRVRKHGKVGREEAIKERTELRDDIIGGTGNRDENRLVLHPFFGYTYNQKDKGINNFGFWTNYDISLENSGYVIKNSVRSELLRIGIFGGSFAGGIGSQDAYLEEKLKPIFPDKKPIVLNFGVGGHAFPQSALIYIYFKELFDVVVFIDGLNELWNYVDNNRVGVPPEYAKAVHYIYKISRQELTPSQFDRTSQIISLKRKIDTIASLSLLPIIKQSIFVHYVWKALQTHWSRKIAEISLGIVKGYERGEKFFDMDDDAILNYAARQWGSYHKLVHHLSAIEGVLSIHLLQPNPLVPDSKSLTVEEKNRIANSFPIRQYVVNGYQKLQTEISNLRQQGLIAEDLTGMFKSVDTSIWGDSAHVNEKGSRLVVDKIVELIGANKKMISNLRKLEVSNENGSGGRKSVLQPHEALQAFPELP